jgi:hypothetical protein
LSAALLFEALPSKASDELAGAQAQDETGCKAPTSAFLSFLYIPTFHSVQFAGER